MNITVLDTEFNTTQLLEVFTSFIWTDCYRKYGEFEIYTAVTESILSNLKKNYYVTNGNSEHAMIIEDIDIDTDEENGNVISITGRSLESILYRRIVWGMVILNGGLQDEIERLLNENIINPANEDRKIDNFIFKRSTDPRITDLTINAQYTGDYIYDIIAVICEGMDIGFKVTLNDKNQFVFELYVGTDRSYNQSENSYVVFSPQFENIVNSKYFTSNKDTKNVTLIGGEGEGEARKYASVGFGTGLERRETFTDARDISSEYDGVKLTDEAYTALLAQKGNETLAELTDKVAFEGEVETTQTFVYGEDFFVGDTVSIQNEYGIEATPQIIEVVESFDESGYSIIPTFKYTYKPSYILSEDSRVIKTQDNEGIILDDGLDL